MAWIEKVSFLPYSANYKRISRIQTSPNVLYLSDKGHRLEWLFNRLLVSSRMNRYLRVLPLLIASGAGAEARKVMGMTVFSGMLVATVVGVLIVPALYVIVQRYISKSKPATAAVPATAEEEQS